MSFGSLVKARRVELGVSQGELAKMCGYTSRSTICKIEHGERDVPIRQLKLIAAALKMEAADLVKD